MNNTTLHVAAALLALTSALFVQSIARATDLPVVADTYTDVNFRNANYGKNGIVAVSTGRVALLRFDSVAISRTSGGTAALKIKVLLVKNPTDNVTARLVLGPWSEATVTAGSMPPISRLSLDEKTIRRADQGTTVSFDISGALTVWKNDPSRNFGIALTPTEPTPNVQLGARELKSGATLSITGPAQPDGRLWVAYGLSSTADTSDLDALDLLAGDGKKILTVPAPPGQRFAPSIAADPLTGGVWATTIAIDDPINHAGRLMRVGPTGRVEQTVSVVNPAGIAVDPRDGSVWTSECTAGPPCEFSGSAARHLLKFNRDGQKLVEISGAPTSVNFQLDEVSGTLWVNSFGRPYLYRVSGTDAQLNGYDIDQDSGPHHQRTFIWANAIALNSNEDGQGRGNLWFVGGPPGGAGGLFKLDSAGSELSLTANVGQLVAVNPLTGGTIQLVDECCVDGGYLGLGYNFRSSLGDLTGFSRLFPSIPYFFPDLELNGPPLLDPYRNLIWTPLQEVLRDDTDLYYVAALDPRSHSIRTLRVLTRATGQPYGGIDRIGVALQSISARIAIGNNGVINPSQSGLITASVLSNGEFDALQVDPTRVRFGPGRAAPKAYRVKDVDGNGAADLQVDLAIAETGFTCNDLYAGLTAATYDSIPIAGNARITVQGCP